MVSVVQAIKSLIKLCESFKELGDVVNILMQYVDDTGHVETEALLTKHC